jgi:hypothetical protein
MKSHRGGLVVVLLASQVAYGAEWSKPVERATPVPAWHATLIESEHCVVESDVCEVTLYLQPDGSKRHLLASHVIGDVIALSPWRTIFSCEENSIMGTSAPLLISLDGKVTHLRAHAGFLRQCMVVGDSAGVALIYNVGSEKSGLHNIVRVFDGSGKLVLEKTLSKASAVEATIGSQTYKVPVPEPEEPG